mgnify:CR=1 FL=1
MEPCMMVWSCLSSRTTSLLSPSTIRETPRPSICLIWSYVFAPWRWRMACPPPAIADVAVEKAAEAHHLRPWNTHLFILPSLMTNRWRRQLLKASDLLLVLPFGRLWPRETEFERLTLALIFPLLRGAPWRIKLAEFWKQVVHSLQRMRDPDESFIWDCLCQLWVQAGRVEPMPSSFSRGMLHHSPLGPFPLGSQTPSDGSSLPGCGGGGGRPRDGAF